MVPVIGRLWASFMYRCDNYQCYQWSMFIVCTLQDKVQKHDCTQTGRQS